MKFRSLMTAICVLATANIVSAAVAPFAYIANSGTNNVSVIRTDTNAVTATVTLPVGTQPYAYSVAVSPSGQYVYVGIQGTNKIAIIDAATNTLLPQVINLNSDSPGGLAINAAETRLYVASNKSNTLIVIDITNIKSGSGPIAEVGRVAVEDVPISSPEGVVILSDVNGNSLKAYVANSAKGTIAEVSIDETGNLYTRNNLIALGNNAQPMGLTLNSAGTKLYAAGFNGHASVVDTASRAVTDLVLGLDAHGTGNLSVAITPDDSKIYAPSAGYNNLYVVNGTTVTELGLQNSLLNSPWGSAVVPVTPKTNTTKLYVAMNLSNDVKVFNTSTNSLSATIDLTPTAGPNAKSTSLGDFIGPEFPWTITTAAQTNCTIAPSGIIPVTELGRAFKVTATGGQCEVWTGTTSCSPTRVGGTSHGFPVDNYNYVNGAANGTICAEYKAGTYYMLSGGWITSVDGWLVSNPAGIDKTTKSASFSTPTSVILSVGDSANHQVRNGSWTGDCAYANSPFSTTCTLVMNANKTFGAEIIPAGGSGPIKNETKGTYHQTLGEATAAATTNDAIKISTTYITGGSTTGSSLVTVSLSGGWDSGFGSQTKPSPVSMGPLTITSVAVIADNLTI